MQSFNKRLKITDEKSPSEALSMAAATLPLCASVREQITCTFRSREHGGGDGAGRVEQMTNRTPARAPTLRVKRWKTT